MKIAQLYVLHAKSCETFHCALAEFGLTLILFECGSVQTKMASMSLTLDKFFSFFRHNAINSLDSKAAVTQKLGGFKYLKIQKRLH